MLEFPVDVIKTESGTYSARLVDLPDGPTGLGVDPYAALNDLSETAHKELLKLNESDALPEPSSINDRPTISFDGSAVESGPSSPMNSQLVSGIGDQNEMLGYTWTNDVVFHEE